MNHETLLCAMLIVNVPFCVPLTLGVSAIDDVTLDSTESHLKETDMCMADGSVANPQPSVTTYLVTDLELKAQKKTHVHAVLV